MHACELNLLKLSPACTSRFDDLTEFVVAFIFILFYYYYYFFFYGNLSRPYLVATTIKR